jgi:hypothetical protein
MTPRDSYDTVGALLDVNAMLHGFIAEAVEAIPEARMTDQPGSVVNHPAWTISHLNAYAGVLLSMLDDPSSPRRIAGTILPWASETLCIFRSCSPKRSTPFPHSPIRPSLIAPWALAGTPPRFSNVSNLTVGSSA